MLIENYNEIEALDKAIAKQLERINNTDYDSDDYAKMAENLTKLIKNKQIIADLKLKSFDATEKRLEFAVTADLKERELTLKREELEVRSRDITNQNILKGKEIDLKQSEADKPDRVSKETLAVIGANLAGIVIVLGYEKFNVIASKAFSLVQKVR